MRSSRFVLWDLAELWMRSSRVVRASDCQCRCRICPGTLSQYPPTQWRIWGTADEVVLYKYWNKKKSPFQLINSSHENFVISYEEQNYCKNSIMLKISRDWLFLPFLLYFCCRRVLLPVFNCIYDLKFCLLFNTSNNMLSLHVFHLYKKCFNRLIKMHGGLANAFEVRKKPTVH